MKATFRAVLGAITGYFAKIAFKKAVQNLENLKIQNWNDAVGRIDEERVQNCILAQNESSVVNY